MAAFIRKNLTFLILKHASNKNVDFCISPVSVSLPLHFFSTQTLHLNPNPTVYDILVHKHHFPCQFASRVTSQLSRIKNPETVDSMLSFLKSSGFSSAHLQKIIKYRPSFLCFSLERIIKPKIKRFEDEGFSSADIAKIISRWPSILALSMKETIIPSLSVLRDLLGSNDAVITIVKSYPQLLNCNMKKNFEPNIEFLKRCGVPVDRIRLSLNNGYPRAFHCNPQAMRAYVEKTKEMGLSVSSKPFIYAIQTISSMGNGGWELKLQAFRDTGFSESDILRMFRKEPRAFSVSAEKLKKITEGLVATGKYDMSSIVHHPAALRHSFETRYKPRIRILRILESRKLIEDWPPLSVLSTGSEAKFSERFVRPYINEISDAYMEELKIKHLLL